MDAPAKTAAVFKFLMNGRTARREEWPIGQKRAAHVVAKFRSFKGAECSAGQGSKRGKHSLTVTKQGSVKAFSRWQTHHQEFTQMLDSVSTSPDTLRIILGSRYDAILRLIEGEDVTVGLPASNEVEDSIIVNCANTKASHSRLTKRRRVEDSEDED